MKVKDIELRQEDSSDQRQVLLIEGKKCLMPFGMTAIDMSGLTEMIVGNLTPAVSFGQKVRINNDVEALLTINTICHECTHLFQERRMGWLGYRATYFWQMLISLFRVGITHIHANHIMEQEARLVGITIAEKGFDYSTGYLDIEAEIKRVMNW